MDTLIAVLQPHLFDLLGIVLTGVISLGAARVTKLTGIQIEARHREALHSAIMTAARAAASRGLTSAVAVEFVTAYVRGSVPGALRALRPSAETLETLARAKLAEIIGR